MTLANSNNRTRQSQLYYNFDTSPLSQIPSIATITSVAANVKYYVNNTTYVTAVSIQLYSNTTAKGSAVTDIPTGTSGTKYTLTTGSWTRSELENARLYVSATHNASTNAGYLYFFGADLTVNYSVNGTEYEVSFNNQSSDVTTGPSTTQYVFQGGSQDILFYGINDLEDVSIKDNNSVITPVPASGSPAFIVSDYVGTTLTYRDPSGTTNGCNGVDNTSVYAGFRGNNTSGGYADYAFTVTGIPSAAEISSVSCQLRGARYSTYSWGAVLCKGDTAVTDVVSVTAQSNSSSAPSTNGVFTITSNNFLASDLSNIRLRLIQTTASTNTRVWFYGATLTVTYNVNGAYFYAISNISTDHVISIEDVGGTYYNVNASSTYTGATVSPATQSVREGRNGTVTITTADVSKIIVTDNNVDVTSQLVPGTGESGETTCNLGTFDSANSVYDGIYSTYEASRAEGKSAAEGLASTSATRSSFYVDSGKTMTIFYNLNTSSLNVPAGSIITNVSCSAVCSAAFTGENYTTKTVQLYTGTTPKGSATNISVASSAAENFLVDGGNEWTTSELSQAKLVIYGERNDQYSSGTSAERDNLNMHGATLRVTYEFPSSDYKYTVTNVQTAHTIVVSEFKEETMYVKQNGTWVELRKVYKKVNGNWVEQTDLTDVFDTGTIYVHNQ